MRLIVVVEENIPGSAMPWHFCVACNEGGVARTITKGNRRTGYGAAYAAMQAVKQIRPATTMLPPPPVGSEPEVGL